MRNRMWLLTAMLFAAAPARAQNAALRDVPPEVFASQSPFRLEYDHVTGLVRLFDQRGKAVGSWDYSSGAPLSGAWASVPPDRPLVVVVDNANPLLYRYDVTSAIIQPLGVKTCSSLGGQFLQQGFLAGIAAVRGMTSVGPAYDSLFRGPLTAQQLAGKGATDGGAKGSGRLSQNDWNATREPLRDYLRFSGQIDETANAVSRSLAIIAELGESRSTDSLLRMLQDSISSAAPGLSHANEIPRTAFDRLTQARPAIASLVQLTTPPENAAPFSDEAIGLRRQVDSALATYAASYRRLQSLLLQVQQTRALTRQTFVLPPSGDRRRVSIELSATDTYKEVPRLSSGRLTAFVEPSVKIHCQLSVGVAFMNEPPKYVASAGVASNISEEEARTTAAILMHVWVPAMGPFAALTGIGLGVNKRPDLYAGLSLRIFAPAIINAGWVWQRSPELPAGMAPPAAVTDAQLAQLPKRFKPGFFAGLSVTR